MLSNTLWFDDYTLFIRKKKKRKKENNNNKMFSILCLYKPVILPDISVLSLCVHKQLGGTGSVSGYFFVPLRCHRYSFLLLNSCIPHHLEHLDEIRGESWPFATQVAEIPVFPQGQDFPICLWKRGESQAPILNLSQHLKKKKKLFSLMFSSLNPPQSEAWHSPTGSLMVARGGRTGAALGSGISVLLAFTPSRILF